MPEAVALATADAEGSRRSEWCSPRASTSGAGSTPATAAERRASSPRPAEELLSLLGAARPPGAGRRARRAGARRRVRAVLPHPAARRQIAAWASSQGEGDRIAGRARRPGRGVRARVRGQGRPLPPHWGGYRLEPETWSSGSATARLHDRFRYSRQDGGGWTIERLAFPDPRAPRPRRLLRGRGGAGEPELRRKPLVVGGDHAAAASWRPASCVARQFGIHSAIGCAEALRRCRAPSSSLRRNARTTRRRSGARFARSSRPWNGPVSTRLPGCRRGGCRLQRGPRRLRGGADGGARRHEPHLLSGWRPRWSRRSRATGGSRAASSSSSLAGRRRSSAFEMPACRG